MSKAVETLPLAERSRYEISIPSLKRRSSGCAVCFHFEDTIFIKYDALS